MVRRVVSVSVLVVCVAVILSAQAMVERSILVTVLDRAGAPLRDLTASEFIVQEDGQRREVTSAVLATEPMSVALLIDTSKPAMGTEFPVRDVRTGLAAIVKAIDADNPASEVSLMDYAGVLQHAPPAADGDLVLARRQGERAVLRQEGSPSEAVD